MPPDLMTRLCPLWNGVKARVCWSAARSGEGKRETSMAYNEDASRSAVDVMAPKTSTWINNNNVLSSAERLEEAGFSTN